MNAQEYLSQAFYLDRQIQSKLTQIDCMRKLASCISPRPTDQAPVCHTRNVHAMEDTILKIYEMNRELDAQIDALVDRKIEISRVIAQVENAEYQLVPEKRHLIFMAWSDIAAEMHCSVRTVLRIYARALEAVEEILVGSTRSET